MTTHHSFTQPEHVIVVGGSLAGLMAALCLARTGRTATVLERRGSSPRTGAALRVSPSWHQNSGWSIRAVASDGAHSPVQAWSDVHARLSAAAAADPRIELRFEETAASVSQNQAGVTVLTASGEALTGSVVVGADGHGSMVRHEVAPQRPDSVFAGYVLWLGIVDEQSVPPLYRWPAGPGQHAYLEAHGDILLGYPLAGVDGSTEQGRRRLGWAWYDSTHNDVFRDQRRIVKSVVRGSLPADAVPQDVLNGLRAASGRWPHPWRDVIDAAIEQRDVIGTPVSEYVPEKLVNGRLVLVGDAAHVPTPMTGLGFDSSLDDAESLADKMNGDGPVAERLLAYEGARLHAVQQLVQHGQDFSRSFAGATR